MAIVKALQRNARIAAVIAKITELESPYVVTKWAKTEYGLTDRAATRLVNAAVEFIARQQAVNAPALRNWHRRERIQLIKESKFAEDYSTAARVLADLAKIDGVYPSEKIEVEHSGKVEISFQWPEKTIEAEVIDDKDNYATD